jgi:hypothetical protein
MPDARQVSPLHVPNLPTIPSPTIHRRPKAESGCFLGRTAAAPSQGSTAPTQAGFRSASVGLRLSKGRLATTTDRIEFVILRTGHSPPGALHLPSLGRSSSRLRDADSIPARTSTLLVRCTCGRTLAGRRPLESTRPSGPDAAAASALPVAAVADRRYPPAPAGGFLCRSRAKRPGRSPARQKTPVAHQEAPGGNPGTPGTKTTPPAMPHDGTPGDSGHDNHPAFPRPPQKVRQPSVSRRLAQGWVSAVWIVST